MCKVQACWSWGHACRKALLRGRALPAFCSQSTKSCCQTQKRSCSPHDRISTHLSANTTLDTCDHLRMRAHACLCILRVVLTGHLLGRDENMYSFFEGVRVDGATSSTGAVGEGGRKGNAGVPTLPAATQVRGKGLRRSAGAQMVGWVLGVCRHTAHQVRAHPWVHPRKEKGAQLFPAVIAAHGHVVPFFSTSIIMVK